MGWFRRVMTRATAPQVPKLVEVSPVRAVPDPVEEVSAVEVPPLPPFDQLMAMLGLEGLEESPPTPDEVEVDEVAASAVVGHYREHRPPPSSLPSVSLQVLRAVAAPELSMADVSRLVAQDPAISAEVLRVANSAAATTGTEVGTLRQAVTRLGLTEVGRIAGAVAAWSLFEPSLRAEHERFGSVAQALFADAVVSARAAAWLAMRVKAVNADHIFLAGLLHDLGKAVALRSVAALSEASGLGLDPRRVERVLHAAHVEVGTDVHAHWQLPAFPSLVARTHHDSGLPSHGEHRDVHIVRLCSAMVLYRRQGFRLAAIREEIDESALVLGLDGFGLRALDTQIRAEIEVLAQRLVSAGR